LIAVEIYQDKTLQKVDDMQQLQVLNEQSIVDREQLRMLSLFHYVAGGVSAFTSFILLAYLFFGIAMAMTSSSDARIGGYIISTIFGACFVFAAAHAGLTVYAGRCIAQRKAKVFTLVMAALNCLNFPYGTILGVCTMMVLTRGSVNQLYSKRNAPGAGNSVGPKPGSIAAKSLPGIGSPPPIVPIEPFANHDLHKDHDEEQMWKELERRASQKTATEDSADKPPSA
jgi:hypothetical protein